MGEFFADDSTGGFAAAAAIAMVGLADETYRSTVGRGVQAGPNQLPKINGIPCDGTNSGTCIGLSRQPNVAVPEPDTNVSQSP